MYYQQMYFVHMNDNILYLILIHEINFVLILYQEESDLFPEKNKKKRLIKEMFYIYLHHYLFLVLQIYFEIFYKEYFQFVQYVFSID